MTPALLAAICGSNIVRSCEVVLGVVWRDELRQEIVYGSTGPIGRTRGAFERMEYLHVKNAGRGRANERRVHDLADLLFRALDGFPVECGCGSRYCERPICSDHDECRADMEMAAACARARGERAP